jgi:hypothetical protein
MLLSGSLPPGLSLTSTGVISGTPTSLVTTTEFSFGVRVTDNEGSIKDRTFSINVILSTIPSFNTLEGEILSIQDSVWTGFQIEYTNPNPNNPVYIDVIQGLLPAGLEINSDGFIRGYALPPTIEITEPSVSTAVTVSETTTNILTCLSTSGFSLGRPITFSGITMFGGLSEGIIYYVKNVINGTSFTISTTPNGTTLPLSNGTGYMTATLDAIAIGQPTVRTYNFSLKLTSPLGSDVSQYSITVANQNAPVSQGGPGRPTNSRVPAILNTRPESYSISTSPYYGYYFLPDASSPYNVYPISYTVFIGTFDSDNYFSFKVIGKDFDNGGITYSYTGLPSGLTGNSMTGWITGTPTLSSTGLTSYSFSVFVYKTSNLGIQSESITFKFNISNQIKGNIVWNTDSDLGYIYNGTVSTKYVSALSDVQLSYRVVSGSLPSNLSLLANGEITGIVANQPTNNILNVGDSTDFVFAIEAYDPTNSIITSQKTFTLTIIQKYKNPTDILYIKASPSIEDRNILNTLLDNSSLIPDQYLYRPNDPHFGKASSILYEHAYGIFSSDFTEYIDAVTKNHYWRNITLGELKTAIAKDETGRILYEVVYSQVIDNLQNPQGISVSSDIAWPRPINLYIGPWYTSVTNIFTSYEIIDNTEYYTSLSPGYTRELYPNSLFNMRNRVGEVLGQETDSTLLPLWMTSQQENGSTLGYTQAWVICYTKPGYSKIVKNNINTMWNRPDGLPYSLNKINFKIDRFSVNKEITYNYDNNVSPPAWTTLPSATPIPNPTNAKDFYVLFPRKTILPNQTQ